MPLNAPQLLNIQAEVKQGRKPTATVRELLQWFGVKRRGSYVVEQVRDACMSFFICFQGEAIE
jgi:hypothetical protein